MATYHSYLRRYRKDENTLTGRSIESYDNTKQDPLAKYLETYSDPEQSKIDNEMFGRLKQEKIERQNRILDQFKVFSSFSGVSMKNTLALSQ